MRKYKPWLLLAAITVCWGCGAEPDRAAKFGRSVSKASLEADGFSVPEVELAADLAQPIRLEAAGQPIDIGALSSHAHAGPWIADVDCDGDNDLLVGDFPGHFWFFANESTNQTPKYAAAVKLQAGGVDAKVPVS